MNSFELNFNTKIAFGKGVDDKVGETLSRDNVKNALVCYDVVAEKKGLLDKIVKQLQENSINVTLFSDIRSNPELKLVYKAIDICHKNSIDCLVAIGGGSVLDSCKAIAVGAANPDIDIWDCYLGKIPSPPTAIKIAAIPTTAATGSETNPSSVLSNDATAQKRSLFSDASRPAYAFMNPEQLYTLPLMQRNCTVVDIFVHTHERYCASRGENKVSDTCSEGNMKTLLEVGPTFIKETDNYDAASEIMWAGTNAYLSGGLGGKFDWSTHNLGHEISGHYHDKIHATTITTMWGYWAKYVCDANVERFAQFARNVFGVSNCNDKEAATEGIERTINFFKEYNMPTSITELMGRKFTSDEINELVDSCTYNGERKTIGALKPLDKNDILAIYNMANV
ncbi:iron-containing alcohol dehydrogenase [Candidatus Epulonipiscium viviparus]|uniref:iron-containing alcohol dehydrogenase n=1 Tax=Candidatus Epulonipiscium viviparus TaxID=420336 RepID=UPI00016C02F3|nr:iron-containing alcohol dehydrogenase [Candidatus Epulopiscium viviparus]